MGVYAIVQATLSGTKVDLGQLGKPSAPVTEFGPELIQLVEDLRDTMWSYDICVGLAAPQIGRSSRVAVTNSVRENREDDLILVNPTVVAMSGKKVVKRESCMSLWGFQGDVERRSNIVVRYFDIAGLPHETDFHDFEARVVMHEVDHLDGVLYCGRLVEGTGLSDSEVFSDQRSPSDVTGRGA